MEKNQIKRGIFKSIRKYYKLSFAKKEFIPGKTYIPIAAKVFDEREMIALSEAVLDFWLTEGRFAKLFEKKFSKLMKVPNVVLTNSG